MDPFAVDEDIEAVWRPLTAGEQIITPGLIDQASLKLRIRIPNIDTVIASSPLKAAAATAAVVNAVKRVLMNPQAARQISTTTGPMTESVTVDTALSSGMLYIDSGDLAGLLPVQSGIRSFRVRAGLL